MSSGPAESLLALQSVDVEILRAEKRLEELPEKRAILEARARLKEMVALREKAALLDRKLQSELKSRQDEIASITAKMDTEQNKIMVTTDHRQIQALTREMDGLRRRVDKLEMESIQYMERIDKAASQIATVDAHLEKLTQSESGLVTRYKQVGGALQDEIAQFKSQRVRLEAVVGADLLARYEKARDVHGGIGAGRLDGASCTACHMSLPAERVRDLLEGPQVGVCPQCRRLIVVRSESA
ncbi:MAG: hypothetical protein U1E26_05090 [Coriobacteriia bacterium]|nr:hypothetical protein [Coriobacteriia bacterium]